MTPKYEIDRGDDDEGDLEPLDVGDRARDRRHGGTVWVVDQLEEPAREVTIARRNGQAVTVADYHRGDYPEDDPVVRVVWDDDLDDLLRDLDHTVDRERIAVVLHLLEVGRLQNRHGGEVKVYHHPRSRLERRT